MQEWEVYICIKDWNLYKAQTERKQNYLPMCEERNKANDNENLLSLGNIWTVTPQYYSLAHICSGQIPFLDLMLGKKILSHFSASLLC